MKVYVLCLPNPALRDKLQKGPKELSEAFSRTQWVKFTTQTNLWLYTHKPTSLFAIKPSGKLASLNPSGFKPCVDITPHTFINPAKRERAVAGKSVWLALAWRDGFRIFYAFLALFWLNKRVHKRLKTSFCHIMVNYFLQTGKVLISSKFLFHTYNLYFILINHSLHINGAYFWVS